MSADARSIGGITKAPPWHGWVTADLFLSSLGAGTFSVAAICLLARTVEFAPAARIAFLIVFPVMLADLVCLVFDLGDPMRFHHMLRVFKPGSPMSVGTWTLSTFTFVAFLAFAATILRLPDSVLEAIAVVGLIPALGAGTYKGVLLSTTAQPGWREMRWLGATVSISSASMGLAVLLVIGDALALPSLLLRVSLGLFLVLYTIAFFRDMTAVNMRDAVTSRWISLLYSMLFLPFVFLLRGDLGAGLLAALGVMIHAALFRHLLVVIPHRLPAK